MESQPARIYEPLIVPAALDPDAVKICRRLKRYGHEAYLVGGCVRDLSLGHIPKDFDVATSARPRQIKRLFRNARIIGRRFKLVHIQFGDKIIEVSTFRKNPNVDEEPEGEFDGEGDASDEPAHGGYAQRSTERDDRPRAERDDGDDGNGESGDEIPAADYPDEHGYDDPPRDEGDEGGDDPIDERPAHDSQPHRPWERSRRSNARGGEHSRSRRHRGRGPHSAQDDEDDADDGGSADSSDLLIRRDNVFGTAEEDAVRRDFTINALFYDVDENVVIDYVGGTDDLARRLIRTIGDPEIRFQEDPVRILRAIKFAARLGFDFDDATYAAMIDYRTDLRKCAPPRLTEELLKILSCGAAAPAFDLLRSTGVLATILPEIDEFLDRDQHESTRSFAAESEFDTGDGNYDDPPAEEEHAPEHSPDDESGAPIPAGPSSSELMRGYLEVIDHADRGRRSFGNATLFCALLVGLIREAIADPEGPRDPGIASDRVMRPFAQRMAISRRDAFRVKQIVVALSRFKRSRHSRRRRRVKPMDLVRRDYFKDALDFYRIESIVRGDHNEDEIQHWLDLYYQWLRNADPRAWHRARVEAPFDDFTASRERHHRSDRGDRGDRGERSDRHREDHDDDSRPSPRYGNDEAPRGDGDAEEHEVDRPAPRRGDDDADSEHPDAPSRREDPSFHGDPHGEGRPGRRRRRGRRRGRDRQHGPDTRDPAEHARPFVAHDEPGPEIDGDAVEADPELATDDRPVEALHPDSATNDEPEPRESATRPAADAHDDRGGRRGRRRRRGRGRGRDREHGQEPAVGAPDVPAAAAESEPIDDDPVVEIDWNAPFATVDDPGPISMIRTGIDQTEKKGGRRRRRRLDGAARELSKEVEDQPALQALKMIEGDPRGHEAVRPRKPKAKTDDDRNRKDREPPFDMLRDFESVEDVFLW